MLFTYDTFIANFAHIFRKFLSGVREEIFRHKVCVEKSHIKLRLKLSVFVCNLKKNFKNKLSEFNRIFHFIRK